MGEGGTASKGRTKELEGGKELRERGGDEKEGRSAGAKRRTRLG
jgi:hypothetical protein